MWGFCYQSASHNVVSLRTTGEAISLNLLLNLKCLVNRWLSTNSYNIHEYLDKHFHVNCQVKFESLQTGFTFIKPMS